PTSLLLHPPSLHDALPILLPCEPNSLPFAWSCRPGAGTSSYGYKRVARANQRGKLMTKKSSSEGKCTGSVCRRTSAGRRRLVHVDRKSTRLNSSHEWISYA